MRTLLVSEIFAPRTGGSGRWFWEIYRRLPRDRFAIAAGEDPRQEAFDRGHDLRLFRVPLAMRQWGLRSRAGLAGYWRGCRRLGQLIQQERVGMLHCARPLPEGFIAWLMKVRHGIPYACYVHGEELTCASSSRELRWMLTRVLRAASFIIANSHNTERILRRRLDLPAGQIRVLHPGVDTDRFRPAAPDAQVRSRFGWGDRPVLLSVGRLQKRKGHDQVIRALSAIRAAVPDVLYAIIGDGEEREPLTRLVAEHDGLGDCVQFLGELDDAAMIQCYQQCDLFVLANRQIGEDIEGFGMVLLEAQACGKPVLAGASGGTAETMRIPETGRVVPCDHPAEIAGAIRALLADRDRLARMGQAAREWVVEHFDWTALTRQAEQVFRGDVIADTSSRVASDAALETACSSRGCA
jgi:phosphatidylinositol alpha-1,6-mannosyltransferase